MSVTLDTVATVDLIRDLAAVVAVKPFQSSRIKHSMISTALSMCHKVISPWDSLLHEGIGRKEAEVVRQELEAPVFGAIPHGRRCWAALALREHKLADQPRDRVANRVTRAGKLVGTENHIDWVGSIHLCVHRCSSGLCV